MKKDIPKILWSSEEGDLRKKRLAPELQDPFSQRLKIQVLTQGRKGKTVTLISGLPHNPEFFKKLTQEIKNLCGCGGSFKDQKIEMQGNQEIKVRAHLLEKGFKL